MKRCGNLTYYFHGMWVQRHSAISDLPYMEAQVLHTGRSMVEWSPENLKARALLEEFMYHPSQHTIDLAVADRVEALRLNQASLDDVEAVKASLPRDEYDKLKSQLLLQRRFVETSIPHIEAFLRYWIERYTPSADNRAKLEKPLAELEKKAAQVEAEYHEEVPILSGKLIRTYISQVREAVAALGAK